ncbi:hypothetical protein C7C46_30845 [Streptomyces tateyamensis]|uniref:DUF4190 domain-containing protein n=1 Tax=Streptomyces tateyamensis TaxID=565073 RepID=A0A2V4NXT3_9ACTN|nr:DUF4190 domain-containing protein [Streptomyces tateyamensis]PYC66975.1 hypothetical protein C7C46_30845 [Streptomyces tateyamensis]
MSIPPNDASPQQGYGAPQQPYGVPPQEPYGYPAPVAQPTGSNGFAVAGLILAFFFAPLGLIFSIIGLAKSNKAGKGKVMSIIGLIVSLIAIAVGVAVFALVGTKVAKALDSGCTSATSTVTSTSDKMSADSGSPDALKADLKNATDQLNTAAAKAGNADAKSAITALAGDYQQLYTALSTGTAPSADLSTKIEADAKKVDDACGHNLGS